ncbi:MAG TPA: hypothetical protein VGH28_00720 [Polyangiaceae bacterium]
MLLVACGSSNGVAPPDAGGDVVTQQTSGQWVWESDVPATGTLKAIWAASATDVWAGGDNGLMLHWNGSAWSKVDAATISHVSGIWGTSANDVWATAGGIGGTNANNLVHWNGQAWSPVDPGTTINLASVWGTSPSDVYAVGASGVAGTVIHFDGATWSSLFDSGEMAPSGVAGSGASDVWVVGGNFSWAGNQFILHGASSGFSPVSSGVTQSLGSVFASSSNDAWAKGAAGLFHWNGTSWSPVPTTLGLGEGGVWGLGADAVFAVGGAQQIDAWNGSSWSTAHDDKIGAALYAVGGSDASHLWAVGDDATIMRFDTSVTGTPSCADVHGTCGDASACSGHASDYACGGASTCCVAATACGGSEPSCCVNGSDPGPRAVCHNGAFYCPGGASLCPLHP